MPTPTVSKELISVTVRVAVAPDLLQAIVDVIQPSAYDSVVDPACGTGGINHLAHDYASSHPERLTPIEYETNINEPPAPEVIAPEIVENLTPAPHPRQGPGEGRPP